MKVSVITVCKNSAQTIHSCLASVAQQEDTQIEHIIIDGFSSDETIAIVKEHKDRCAHEMVVLTEPDSGIYEAMNKGIGLATGEVICFLNSDDFYLHNRSLQWAVRCMQETSRCYICCQTLVMNEETGRALLTRHRNVNRYYLYKKCFSHPSTFYRKDAFKRCGLFSTRLKIAADYEWYLRAILKHNEQPAFYPVATTVFREGGVSNSKTTRHSKDLEFREVQETYFGPTERFLYRNRLLDFLLEYEWLRLILSKSRISGLRMIGEDTFHHTI